MPFKLGRCSNGEFVPPPLSPVAAEAMRRARQISDDAARRLGWSRRQFLTSSAGMATGLVALQACTDEARRAGATTTGPASTGPATTRPAMTGPGGTFTVPPTAITEPELATTTTQLPPGSLLVDVQNHVLDYELNPQAPTFGAGFPQGACEAGDPRQCFTPERWIDLVFRQSDTTMAVLSAIPAVGDANPLTIEAMERGREMAAAMCGDARVLIQGQAAPDVGPIEAALEAMSAVTAAHAVCAWKVYTHSPNGWFLDDADPQAPQVGERFLAHVEELGVPVVAVHKGLAGGAPFASPRDIGPAAVRHPHLSFLVYHSGYESGVVESEFNPGGAGVDRLVQSLADAGVGPGGNVYAELGTTWRSVMGDLDQAAHVLGKLLLAVGDDNVVWGTDSIWYGSPQDQIAALHAFEITPEFQERFGYPALTAERKAKILGLNAVRVLGIAAPIAGACPPEVQAGLRRGDPLANVAPGPVSRRDVLATFVREHPWVR
ncbi:MAG: amidohydrolase family protein [Actinomycetota bacterium]|nr:amidohydrolase family protein [Actinomycetota bacterium]